MPSAASPRPISSGWWWLRSFAPPRRRFTRDGTLGLSVRFLRRLAMRACFDAHGVSPTSGSAQTGDPLDQQLDERAPVDRHPDLRVRLVLGAAPEIDDGSAPGKLRGAVD